MPKHTPWHLKEKKGTWNEVYFLAIFRGFNLRDEQDQQKSAKTLHSPLFFLLLARLVQFLHFFLQSEQISNAFISAPVTLPRQSRKMQPNGTRWCASKNGWIFLIGPIFYVCVSAKKNKVATPQKHGSRGVPWGEPEKNMFFNTK